MKTAVTAILGLFVGALVVGWFVVPKIEAPQRWSTARANSWYASQGWIVGANFIPSTASNQLEMWQADTFDLATIDRELGFAEQLGMNSMRVFLHNLLWQQDSSGFLRRIDQFLQVADHHHIRITFVLFDGCWNPQSKLGPQPDPRPFVHNSTWVESPSIDLLNDEGRWEAELKPYVKGIIGHFKNDNRVLMWDLYNEPDNRNEASYNDAATKPVQALKLLRSSFEWARSEKPSQPLTSAVWVHSLPEVARFQIEHSDVISFHSYDRVPVVILQIHNLRHFQRPLVCTEYMARSAGSTLPTILPVLKKEHVGGYNWGFVSGRTQTIFPASSWTETVHRVPQPWFHDLLYRNGQPYDRAEVEVIHQLTR